MFCFAKKNAILLIRPIEEISLQPELSSQLRFRIQGGGGTVSMTHEGPRTKDEGRKSLCLILDRHTFKMTRFPTYALHRSALNNT